MMRKRGYPFGRVELWAVMHGPKVYLGLAIFLAIAGLWLFDTHIYGRIGALVVAGSVILFAIKNNLLAKLSDIYT